MRKISKIVWVKLKWSLMIIFVFFTLIMLIPILLVTTVGEDDSTAEEGLIIHTTPSDVISDALECERMYKGDWLSYMLAQYIDSEFQWDEIDYTGMQNLARELKNKSLKEILGEEKYKTYKEMMKYYKCIYEDLAYVKKEKYTYKDKDGNEKYKYQYITKYNITYPIPEGYDYYHNNDYGAKRTFGGDRSHMGNDIMAEKGTPIVAVASGRVEKMGWNTLGGWRISIIDDNDRYWYYAHLSNYERGISEGDRVKAGEIIGYIGNSGYGPEGTTGEFDPHLHIQIGAKFPEQKDVIYFNPYGILRFAENNKTELEEDEE